MTSYLSKSKVKFIKILHGKLGLTHLYLKFFLLMSHCKKKRFIDNLPWYLIMGDVGSGKTKLLSQLALASLDFDGAFAKKGFIQFCKNSLFLFKECICLEVALGSEFSKIDHAETTAVNEGSKAINSLKERLFFPNFCNFFKKYGYKNQLSGIVFVVDLPNIVLLADRDFEDRVLKFRSILIELQALIKVPVPIYWAFTKCDLLEGFKEFFANFNKEDREQVFGITFPKDIALNDSERGAYFNIEFERLIHQLHKNLLLNLEAEPIAKNRTFIMSFPGQLQYCKQRLLEIMRLNGIMRGAYFVSNVQEGVAKNFLDPIFSEEFITISNEIANPPSITNSFFSKKIFKEVVLPEYNFLWGSHYWQWRGRWNSQLNLLIGLLVLFFGVMALLGSYAINKSNLNKISEYLPAYRQAVYEFSPHNKNLLEVSPLLFSLKNIQSVYADSPSIFSWIELYQPFNIRRKIQQVWEQALTTILIPRVAKRVEYLLQKNDLTVEVLYQALKGYLVLSNYENASPNWLKQIFAYDLSNSLKDQYDEQKALSNYLDEALRLPIHSKKFDATILDYAKKRLQKMPPEQFAYYEMQQAANEEKNYLSLDEIMGPDFLRAFSYKEKYTGIMPKLYTYEGYKDLQGKQSEVLLQNVSEIYQALALNPDPKSVILNMQMTPKLWLLYDKDYTQRWKQMLQSVQVVPFANLDHAIQVIDILTDSHGSLFRLLQLVQDNTSTVHSKYTQTSEHFALLNHLTESLKPSKKYQNLFKNMRALRDYLNNLNAAPNLIQAEFNDAVAISKNQFPNHPLVLLRAQAKTLPQPLNLWFTEVADNAMELLLQGARQAANSAWQHEVFPYYQVNIANKFPFSKNPHNFVSMESFCTFFGSNGIFTKFFKTYLEPFVHVENLDFYPHTFDKNSLGMDHTVLQQLGQALLIHSLYFPNGADSPQLKFLIRPIYLDPEVSSITVQIGSSDIHYRHGPQQASAFSWPFANNEQPVGFAFSDFTGQNYSRSFDGLWGIFAMLNAGRIEKIEKTGRYLWVIEDGNYKAKFELSGLGNLPVLDIHLLQTFDLPSSI